MHLPVQWIPQPLIKATCWMLLHSLWQGLLAALLAGLIVGATRKAGARLRYRLLAMLLLLFLGGAATTFWLEWGKAEATIHTGVAANDILPALPVQDWGQAFVQYFNEHAALVVLAWGLVFIGRLVRLLADMHRVQRLRHRKTMAPGDEWAALLPRLARRLGVRRPVLLLQSALVQVPVTLGYLKPVILVPLGLLSSLPPEQVESILLHELAHIRRSDYLANLLQHGVETIFFFNPGIRWISSLLREEREACCDDMVLAHMPRQKTYVEALVNFQEQLAGTLHPSALAFAGRRPSLLRRIERMIYHHNTTLSSMEKILLGTGLLAMGLLAVAFTQPATRRVAPAMATTQTIPAATTSFRDTLPPAKAAEADAAREEDRHAQEMQRMVDQARKSEPEARRQAEREQQQARKRMEQDLRALEAEKRSAESRQLAEIEMERGQEKKAREQMERDQAFSKQMAERQEELAREEWRQDMAVQEKNRALARIDMDRQKERAEELARIEQDQSRADINDPQRLEEEARRLQIEAKHLMQRAQRLQEAARKQSRMERGRTEKTGTDSSRKTDIP